jgi:hypothetical protein
VETGQNNTTEESSDGKFVRENSMLKITDTGDRNYWFDGPE